MVTTLPVRKPSRQRGFTLIELVVVMAIIALLLAIAAPRYFHTLDKSKEAVLRMNLVQTRDAIDKFYADRGKYPDNLAALVDGKYLRALPFDPITDSSSTWIIAAPEQPDATGVYNLHSAADGAGTDGTPYKSW